MNRFLFAVAWILLLLSSGPAGAMSGTCSKGLTDGYGPESVVLSSLSDSDRERIRHAASTYYVSAKEFAANYGRSFAQLVVNRLHPELETTIVIAMGGAEHLGTLLEMYLKTLKSALKVKFAYVPLSRSVMKPWYASKEDGSGEELSGIGPIPSGYVADYNQSEPDALLKHVEPWDLFSSARLIVIDTGFRGTTVEAVAYLARMSSYKGNVEGVLLSKSEKVVNTIPVASFSLPTLDTPQDRDIVKWAARMDANNVQGVLSTQRPDAFKRSRELLGRGDRVISKSIDDPQALQEYKETLLGLEDGLKGL